ncbi:MAG: Gfo/Idh/MocA family oxidoreductase [Pirellulaceae bacterium]
MPIRFGLVGYGAWGRCHAEAIRRTDQACLAAIAEQSPEGRSAAGEKFPDADIVEDYRALVAREDLDIIDIVLPSFLHYEVAAAAMTSGKHVFLEKPMCLRIDQCEDLIRLAREHDRRLAINHEFRLSSLWGQVKTLVANGYVGQPQYVLVELSRNPYRLGSDGWRFDIDRVGNWILEEPIHFFDLARWYLGSVGQPDTVYAAANSRQSGHPELQDNFSAIMKFHGGAYAVVSQTLSAFEHHQTVKLTGTEGAIWASWSGAMDRTRSATHSLRASKGDEVEDVPVAKASGELYELEEHVARIVSAIANNSGLPCTGEDGRWSVAMCLAAARSVELGELVSID